MSIDDGAVNALYEVTELHVKDEIMRRLEALGITEGTKIRILNRKRNGACIIQVRGTCLLYTSWRAYNASYNMGKGSRLSMFSLYHMRTV